MGSQTHACSALFLLLTLASPGSGQQSAGAGQPNSPPPGQPGQAEVLVPRAVTSRTEVAVGGAWVGVSGSEGKFLTDRYLRSGFNLEDLLLDFRPSEGRESFFNFATRRHVFGAHSPLQPGGGPSR